MRKLFMVVMLISVIGSFIGCEDMPTPDNNSGEANTVNGSWDYNTNYTIKVSNNGTIQKLELYKNNMVIADLSGYEVGFEYTKSGSILSAISYNKVGGRIEFSSISNDSYIVGYIKTPDNVYIPVMLYYNGSTNVVSNNGN